MTNLIPRPTGAPAASTAPDGFTRTESKALARQQNAEIARGLVVAARVQSAGMVAAVGIHTAAMLSRETNFQSDGEPQTAARLNHIVDCYAEYVGFEVNGFRF